MSERFFYEEPIHAERVVLRGSEAHHLLKVMRGRPGDEVVLFDGSGKEFTARIAATGRTDVELVIAGSRAVDRESPRLVTLAVALPKGDRGRWLVEKSVELGVARLVPLATARAVASVTGNALVRLRRSVVEASKQCGRNRLMQVDDAVAWTDLATSQLDGASKFLAHPPENEPSLGAPHALANAAQAANRNLVFAVGPEGGFTDAEVELGRQNGWQRISLGRRTLRVETAAIALAALATS